METRIGTHNGTFHADDALACGILWLVLGDAAHTRIIRSRDPKVLEECDFLVDVGMEYDGTTKFDHHQKGGAGIRIENKCPYASAGLIWRHFGEKFVTQFLKRSEVNWLFYSIPSDKVAALVDKYLFQGIDAADNGWARAEGPVIFQTTSRRISMMNPQPGLHPMTEKEYYTRFMRAVHSVIEELEDLILYCTQLCIAANVADNAERLFDGRVVFLGEDYYDVFPHLSEKDKLAWFVVYQDENKKWIARTIPKTPETLSARVYFPELWKGRREAALRDVSGVADADFCHNGLFICGAWSKEGILQMIRKAVEMALVKGQVEE